jgi:hypothetical protein
MHSVDSHSPVLERMVRAVEKVRNRLLRAASALEKAGVRYAVIGGNAVAAWVATVAESAVRNTQDVDILLDRAEFDRAKRALEEEGFVFQNVFGVDLFLDGPDAHPRDAVHIIFGGEKVRPHYDAPAPDSREAESFPQGIRVLALQSLVRMKLTSFRIKDRMHLLDLIGIGLLGEKDLANLPPNLASKLKELLDNPDG